MKKYERPSVSMEQIIQEDIILSSCLKIEEIHDITNPSDIIDEMF